MKIVNLCVVVFVFIISFFFLRGILSSAVTEKYTVECPSKTLTFLQRGGDLDDTEISESLKTVTGKVQTKTWYFQVPEVLGKISQLKSMDILFSANNTGPLNLTQGSCTFSVNDAICFAYTFPQPPLKEFNKASGFNCTPFLNISNFNTFTVNCSQSSGGGEFEVHHIAYEADWLPCY